MKIEITKKDWDAIYSLIDTLHSWAAEFEKSDSPYYAEYKYFHNQTIERVKKQLNKPKRNRKLVE